MKGDQVELVGPRVEVVIGADAIQGIVGEIATSTSASISLRPPPSAIASTSTP